MALQTSVLERFLRYVKIDTRSDLSSTTTPSTAKQLRLGELLRDELTALGAQSAELVPGGVVYGKLPATPGAEDAPAIGFIAHMDTSPDASGESVKPQIIRFEGKDVVLNAEKNLVFRPAYFPEIMKYAGEEVIFTDGTTLLGADDKAGIAAIMGMAEYLVKHPDIPHAKICIGFTPDEEVARGTESFDIDRFGAKYAYTLDGGEIGALESENFNAATAFLDVEGLGVHPGTSKGKMVNALRLVCDFVAALPRDMAPETTEGYEGFIHPNDFGGDVVHAFVVMLIRDHDRALFEEKKRLLEKLAAEHQAANPKAHYSLRIKDSYENMHPYLEKTPKVLEIARAAYRSVGLEPIEIPIRGGTDGARLTVEGLPCPNVFTGGMNHHGVHECIPVKSLEMACEVAIKLAEMSACVKSLD